MKPEAIVDASICAAWFLRDERTEHSHRLLRMLRSGRLRLVEPVLWRYEMLNALRSAVARNRISERAARRALVSLHAIPVEFIPLETQGMIDILDMALKTGLSAYDAAYLCLAVQRGSDLVTADRALLELQPHFVCVRPLGEFCRDVLGS